MNVLVLYHTSFHSSVYINTIFYVLTIKWHFHWDVFYIREKIFLKIQLILMRRAAFIVLSGLLKLIVCLQSLLSFLFSFIIRSSWMTLSFYNFANTTFLIWFFRSRLCVVFLLPNESNLYFSTFTTTSFISWAYFLSLAPIREVLCNWLNLMSALYTNCSNFCLHAFGHGVTVLECTCPILLRPFHACVFHEYFLDYERLERLYL